MFSWIYQLLLSFVARVLSWFGISFSPKEVSEVSEAIQVAQKAVSDEPQAPEESQGPQPYSAEAPQAPPSLLQ